MSAEVLRRAASLMRERAEATTRDAAWTGGHYWITEVDYEDCGNPVQTEIGGMGAPGDADHYSSWHPAVALAVARWLDADAEHHGYFHLARANCREAAEAGDCGCAYKDCYDHGKWHNCTHGEPDITEALAVAHAYLGESS